MLTEHGSVVARGKTSIKSSQRLIGFSDGVIAIAITILVLQFDVPQIPAELVASQLPQALLALLPQVEMYIVSFIIVGYYWVEHHDCFAHISHVEKTVIWLNLFFLMALCVIPFSAELVGTYKSPFTLTFYFANLSLVGLFQAGIWFRALTHGDLIRKNLHPHYVRYMSVRMITPVLVFLLAIPLSYLHLGFSTSINILSHYPITLLYIRLTPVM